MKADRERARAGRRGFLRGLGIGAVAAVIAPSAARTLRVAADDDARDVSDGDDRPRPGMRWIGHF